MEEIKSLIKNRLKKVLNSDKQLTELEVADVAHRYVLVLGDIERQEKRAN